MSQYISIYNGNVTSGGVDGIAVSEEGNFTNPIKIILDATKYETKYIKLAIRCESGFITHGAATLSLNGANKNKWSLCKDNNYSDDYFTTGEGYTVEFSDSLTFDELTDKNTIFWARVRATGDEPPQIDKSVNMHVEAIVKVADDIE